MALEFPRWVYGTVCVSLLSLAVPAGSLQAQAAGAAQAPLPSSDAEDKARAHFRLGRAHYDNGDFAQAAAEFEEAYRISQRAALLYNLYLAYRDASDTRHAAEALRNYLRLEKDVENRSQLESRLAALDRSLADGTAAQPAPMQPTAALGAPTAEQTAQAQQPAPVAPTQEAPAPVQATEAPQESHPNNLLPIILMGTGGAMIVGGVISYAMSSGKKSDLEKLCPKGDCSASPSHPTPAQVADLQSSGKTFALVGDILFFGGIAAAGTGAVLFIINSAKGSEPNTPPPATTASFACLPGVCGGSVLTRF